MTNRADQASLDNMADTSPASEVPRGSKGYLELVSKPPYCMTILESNKFRKHYRLGPFGPSVADKGYDPPWEQYAHNKIPAKIADLESEPDRHVSTTLKWPFDGNDTDFDHIKHQDIEFEDIEFEPLVFKSSPIKGIQTASSSTSSSSSSNESTLPVNGIRSVSSSTSSSSSSDKSTSSDPTTSSNSSSSSSDKSTSSNRTTSSKSSTGSAGLESSHGGDAKDFERAANKEPNLAVSPSDQLSSANIFDKDTITEDSSSTGATLISDPAVASSEELRCSSDQPSSAGDDTILDDSLSISIDATRISGIELPRPEEDQCVSDQVPLLEMTHDHTIMDDILCTNVPSIAGQSAPEGSIQLLDASSASDPSNLIMSVPRPEVPIRIYEGAPPPFSQEAQSRVMRWTHTRHHFEPDAEWLIEPDVQKIKETLQPHMKRLGYEADGAVLEKVDEGGFHKIFTLTALSLETNQQNQFIVRIPLPVLPYFKTESDVATTEIVRYSTKIPVPIIYAYDSSSDNPLGLEWILMEKIDGKPIAWYWDDMEYDSKLRFTKLMADWNSQLSKITSNKIGSVYMQYTKSRLEFYVGFSTNHMLRQENRLQYNAFRGPFASLQEFYESVLAITIQDFNDLSHKNSAGLMREARYTFLNKIWWFIAQKPLSDEEVREFQDNRERDINELLYATTFLQKSLSSLCEKLNASKELITRLSHHDLSLRNVLVDGAGTPLALIDWELCDFQPLMLLASSPEFIEGDSISYEPKRSIQPIEVMYKHGEEETREMLFRNEEVYLERLEIYHRQKLREEYRDELIRLESPLKEATWDNIDDEEWNLYMNILYPWDNQHPLVSLGSKIDAWVSSIIKVETDVEDEEEDDDESDEENEGLEEENDELDEETDKEAGEIEDENSPANENWERTVEENGEEPEISGEEQDDPVEPKLEMANSKMPEWTALRVINVNGTVGLRPAKKKFIQAKDSLSREKGK